MRWRGKTGKYRELGVVGKEMCRALIVNEAGGGSHIVGLLGCLGLFKLTVCC